MPEFAFHFAQPWWLLGLLLILPVAGWLRYSAVQGRYARIHDYADAHLLPHLTNSRELKPEERWRRFGLWVALWCMAVLAMAGPRWDYTRVQLFSPGSDLVILLDISRSMEVADVQPSRMTRACQEIEDLVDQNPAVRIGLIAFASVAHVASPITEDTATIKTLLPHISPDLVRLQGSRLSVALERARQLLAGQPEKSTRSILLITDGDFADPNLEEQIKSLADDEITLHVMGVGSPDGGPVPAHMGRFMLDNRGKTVESRLDEETLDRFAKAGGGTYITANFRDNDTRQILKSATEDSKAGEKADETAKIWNERFYWLLVPVLLILLTRFRREAVAERAKR
ncbi:vWA domain-containing protein [Solemya velesiana gill symbiont]|uniref:VWA domain-containing protein n=1 Tax=Solemya velesiana gill symbiont TaxID=1918948 RepID=A0A1T2KW12_9GAMM|nr:VWA domain-containing protein [Solemya velesiana gill symbiont]OOZ37047.1 VWA domain-containing protein [Solemya velesiana gill symbiont]